MKIFLSLTFGILMWSLYPLAAAKGLGSMPPFEMIFVVQGVAALGAFILTFLALWRRRQVREYITFQKNLGSTGLITAFVSGASSAFAHGFFMVALTLAHKGGVSLLYESWPVMAILLTPFLINKEWKSIDGKDIALGFVALCGIGIIVLSDSLLADNDGANLLDFKDFDLRTVLGYILTLAGAYMCAVLVVTKGSYSKHFDPLKNSLAAVLIAEMFSRTIGFFIMLFVMAFMGETLEIENIDWFAVLFIGVGVFVIGGAAYTYGLLKASSPNIHIAYYFVPVLAVIWLHIADESPLTLAVISGGVLVVIANAILVWKNKRADAAQKAYAAAS